MQMVATVIVPAEMIRMRRIGHHFIEIENRIEMATILPLRVHAVLQWQLWNLIYF